MRRKPKPVCNRIGRTTRKNMKTPNKQHSHASKRRNKANGRDENISQKRSGEKSCYKARGKRRNGKRQDAQSKRR